VLSKPGVVFTLETKPDVGSEWYVMRSIVFYWCGGNPQKTRDSWFFCDESGSL